MGLITEWGFPFGMIPSTGGRVFWVSPSDTYVLNGRTLSASDDNDGLSPDRARRRVNSLFDTAANANRRVIGNAGDVVVLFQGVHALADRNGTAQSLAMSTAGVTLMGLPSGSGNYLRQNTTINSVSGDQTINVTAEACEIAFLNILPISGDSAIDVTSEADRLHVHHCSFNMFTPATNTGTIGIDVIGAASNLLVSNCYWDCDGAQGPAIVAGAALDSVIEDCTFSVSAGTWANVITQAAAGRRLIIRRCMFHAGNATVTDAILGTTGGEVSMVQISDCRFADSITNAVDDYDVGDAEIVENFQSGLGAGDGGALITATT